MSLNFCYMSFDVLNNICMLGLQFIYVTLCSNNIYMLVIYLFHVTQKHIYDIVVPDICCSKNPTTCTCFFGVCSAP